ncbi:E3 ubiquitin protein ligase upl2 [Reticulomyxa filosa]|uniref:HECT-type E3 ubiquitin transferase n=1 Tax=Reticulomyxa filosa TaxID=46433 RepID=X6MWI1_RETFI|nr:E3 ubiquitin protein ligase upl2 [Reticulomyxa filosa]|eukprot:ETO18353.1 E3 ubiquitin protein ligase upl2 [Reticulomyxa filosa]
MRRYRNLYERSGEGDIANILNRGAFDEPDETVPRGNALAVSSNTSEQKQETGMETANEPNENESKEKDLDKKVPETDLGHVSKQMSIQEKQREAIRTLVMPGLPSLQSNRIPSQFLPPIRLENLKSLLNLMHRTQFTPEESFYYILARLCVYRVMRLVVFQHIFESISAASPRYSSDAESVNPNKENRAKLIRLFNLLKFLMKSPTCMYLVKYLQLPAGLNMLEEQEETPIKALALNNSNSNALAISPTKQFSNEDKKQERDAEIERAIELFNVKDSRMLRVFSLFGSPLMKTQNVLKSFVETLSMICRSSHMKLTELELEMHSDDIKNLVALIGDYVRCDDHVFNKLNTVARSVMNVPNNKLLIMNALITETKKLGTQLAMELNQIYCIIEPSKNTTKRLEHQWNINQTKQNSLLRTIEFFHSLLTKSTDHRSRAKNDNKTMYVFRKIKQDDKTQTLGSILTNMTEQQHTLTMFEDCGRGLESLWEALDRCLTIFGYVPKDVLAAEMDQKMRMIKTLIEKEKEKEKEKSIDQNKDNDKRRDREASHAHSRNVVGSNSLATGHQGTSKKKTEEENTRITSSVVRLKPLILAFFILHDFYQVDFSTKCTPEEMESDVEENLANEYLLSRHHYFLNFTDRHRNIFNLLIAQKPQLLTGTQKPQSYLHRSHTNNEKLGPFAPLIWHPKRVLDLENKKRYLHLSLQAIRNECLGQERDYMSNGRTRLEVRRERLFDDSFCQMKLWTKQELMNRLSVRFLHEEGVDASGLTREWYSQLTKSMFDPSYALFIPAADNNSVFQPNPYSSYNNDHIENFKFVGLFVAKAVFDGQTLEAYFTRSFLKHILHVKPTWEDILSLDYTHYKNLKWMLENPIDGVIDLDFTYDLEKMGVTEKFELRSNGRDIPVTDANKKEYVELVSDLKMSKLVEEQTQAFLKGFHTLIPHWLISIFNWSELDLLICGMPDIDIVDWQNNTQYFGRYTKDSPQIKLVYISFFYCVYVKWFWETVQDMDKEERALLLQFVTGTSKVPLGGFANLPGMYGNQRFQIHSSLQTDEVLPSAHTCFNQLDLPQYSTKEVLKEKLLLAIRECSQGFGFA